MRAMFRKAVLVFKEIDGIGVLRRRHRRRLRLLVGTSYVFKKCFNYCSVQFIKSKFHLFTLIFWYAHTAWFGISPYDLQTVFEIKRHQTKPHGATVCCCVLYVLSVYNI